MNLTLKTTDVGAPPSWLDTTEGLRFLVGGVTIDSAAIAVVDGRRVIRSGTPIIKTGAKWIPAFEVGTAPTAILWETLDVTDGDRHGGALDHGRVRLAALPVAVHADAQAALTARGITFRP